MARTLATSANRRLAVFLFVSFAMHGLFLCLQIAREAPISRLSVPFRVQILRPAPAESRPPETLSQRAPRPSPDPAPGKADQETTAPSAKAEPDGRARVYLDEVMQSIRAEIATKYGDASPLEDGEGEMVGDNPFWSSLELGEESFQTETLGDGRVFFRFKRADGSVVCAVMREPDPFLSHDVGAWGVVVSGCN